MGGCHIDLAAMRHRHAGIHQPAEVLLAVARAAEGARRGVEAAAP